MEAFRITTRRLLIRPLEITDLPGFHFYRSNPGITQYQGFDVMTIEEAEAFIKDNAKKDFGMPGEWVQFGIENRETGKLIGDCAIKLERQSPEIAEIGITVAHTEQKRGYAKEALTGILAFLFDTIKIRRIVEIVDAENAASIRLLESIGFRKEGHFLENIFFKGKWGSELQYAMLQREWNNKKV